LVRDVARDVEWFGVISDAARDLGRRGLDALAEVLTPLVRVRPGEPVDLDQAVLDHVPE
jgi:hypothetical protein